MPKQLSSHKYFSFVRIFLVTYWFQIIWWQKKASSRKIIKLGHEITFLTLFCDEFFGHLLTLDKLGDETCFLTQNKYIGWQNNFSYLSTYLLWQNIFVTYSFQLICVTKSVFSRKMKTSGDEITFLTQTLTFCEKKKFVTYLLQIIWVTKQIF